MWDASDAISNGAHSDAKPPVNGTAQYDRNSLPASPAVASCLPSSAANHQAHHAASKFVNENSSPTYCTVCNCTISEAAVCSMSAGTVSASVDNMAVASVRASVNCHSASETCRHLYSDCVISDDGHCVNNCMNQHSKSTVNGDNVPVHESVCSDCFSLSDGDLRSSCQHSLASRTVYPDDSTNHCSAHDVACDEVLVGAAANTGNVDLTDLSAGILTNADMCDDGYMDDTDVAVMGMVDDQTAARFVETDADTCLDDFIDADMPINAAAVGSASTSSLSSTYDEATSVPVENGINPADGGTIGVASGLELDVVVNSADNQWRSSEVAECSAFGLGTGDLRDSERQNAACFDASRTLSYNNSRCFESDAVMARKCHGINHSTQSSNPASESGHGTPVASVHSPSDDECSATDAEFIAASKSCDDAWEMYSTQSRLKQNRWYWLPAATFPKFGCCSCFKMMNNVGLSLSSECVTSSRPGPADGRDFGIMSRSATADYSSHEHSDLLDDDFDNAAVSARMYSSLTLWVLSYSAAASCFVK